MPARSLFLAALLAAATVAAAPAAAGAAPPVWQPTSTVSGPGADTGWAKVVTGPDGSVFATWLQSDGSHLQLFGRRRSASGVWSAVEPLSSGAPGVTGGPSYLVAMAGDGSLTVGWMKADYSGVLITVHQPGGDWTTPNDSGLDAGEYFFGASLVPGPDDSTVLLTTGGIGSDHRIRIRRRAAGSDSFQVIDEIDTPDDTGQTSPAVAYNEDGDAFAAWANASTPSQTLRGARYDAGTGEWTELPDPIASEPHQVGDVRVALNDDGQAAVVWTTGWADAIRGNAIGRASGTATLIASGPHAVLPTLAADDDGQFVAVWQEFDFAHPDVLPHAMTTTYRPGQDDWTAAEPLADGYSGAPTLAANASGDMVVSLFTMRQPATDPPTPELSVAYRPSGSAGFGPRQAVQSGNVTGGEATGVSSVALDDAGNAAVVFPMLDGSAAVTGFAAGDGAPPRLSGVSVPATASAGEQVAFSADPFDLWSGVGTTSWDFGDGGSASGTSVQHAFPTVGTYDVRVTSTDLAGFSTSVTRQITVSGPSDADDTDDAPPVVIAPVIEARLAGKTLAVNAKVTLKRGQKCKGTITVTTAFGGKTYKVPAKLGLRNGACRATATIRLKKTPSLRTKLRVTVGATKADKKKIAARTITSRRG